MSSSGSISGKKPTFHIIVKEPIQKFSYHLERETDETWPTGLWDHMSCHHEPGCSLRGGYFLKWGSWWTCQVCRFKNQMANQILPWTERLLNQPPSKEQGPGGIRQAACWVQRGQGAQAILRLCGNRSQTLVLTLYSAFSQLCLPGFFF